MPKYKDMEKNFVKLFIGLLISAVMVSCGGGSKTEENLAPNAHKVKAEEVIQTSDYTYVRVSAEGRDYWTAIEKADISVGEYYYWSKGMEVTNFTSKELKRTFRSIFFIEDFSAKPILLQSANDMATSAQMTGKKPIAQAQGLTVPRAEGGITIGELYKDKQNYAGKSVRIRGQVVKYSAAIMNKNWIHLQDGTSDGKDYDLTVTTADSAKVGEVVVFEGKITLDKDFGAGYFYNVIMEDGKLKK
jgi:hypothetical protein